MADQAIDSISVVCRICKDQTPETVPLLSNKTFVVHWKEKEKIGPLFVKVLESVSTLGCFYMDCSAPNNTSSSEIITRKKEK